MTENTNQNAGTGSKDLKLVDENVRFSPMEKHVPAGQALPPVPLADMELKKATPQSSTSANVVTEDVGLSSHPTQNPPAKTPVPPTSPPASPTPSTPVQQDIATILQGVKLPERRTDSAQQPTPSAMPVFDTQLGSSVDMTKPPEQPATLEEQIAQATPAEEVQKSSVSTMRTLKNDLQEIVREQKMSLVRAAALEEDKKRDTQKVEAKPVPTKRKNGTGLMIGFFALLIVAGFGAGAFVFFAQNASVAPSPLSRSLVFAENTNLLPIDGLSPLELKRTLAAARQRLSASLGSITRVAPAVATQPGVSASETPVSFGTFMSALDTHIPDELTRALGDEFFLGFHVVDTNAPVIIVPVVSYERAFAGMLAWEASMNDDLQPLFTAVPNLALGENGLPEKRRFTDMVIRNYDVRALKDDSGTVQLYYSFPTQNLLVIAESPYSFSEILSRLRAERKL